MTKLAEILEAILGLNPKEQQRFGHGWTGFRWIWTKTHRNLNLGCAGGGGADESVFPAGHAGDL